MTKQKQYEQLEDKISGVLYKRNPELLMGFDTHYTFRFLSRILLGEVRKFGWEFVQKYDDLTFKQAAKISELASINTEDLESLIKKIERIIKNKRKCPDKIITLQ